MQEGGFDASQMQWSLDLQDLSMSLLGMCHAKHRLVSMMDTQHETALMQEGQLVSNAAQVLYGMGKTIFRVCFTQAVWHYSVCHYCEYQITQQTATSKGEL